MLDKSLQEQTEKVASKDDFPINWVDRITLFISHTIKYLIPVIVIVMMYEIFMRTQRIFDLISTLVIVIFAAAVIYGGWEDAHRSFTTWERFATFWDPPIPATMKPLTLICVFLIAVQTVNNLIIDWKNPKEKQYDPVKDLK